jgi:hypothetical protein
MSDLIYLILWIGVTSCLLVSGWRGMKAKKKCATPDKNTVYYIFSNTQFVIGIINLIGIVLMILIHGWPK